jgi:uncharacterized phage protein gp47/JayE
MDTQPNFEQIAKDAGVPTTEDELISSYHAELKAQGSKIANDDEYSPFFRLLSAIVTTPALWLIRFLVDVVLPNQFLMTAVGVWLNILAWGYGLTRKDATKALGEITFYREGTSEDLTVPSGIVIESPTIDGVVYRLTTTESAIILDGQESVKVKVIADDVGQGYNLGSGYYSILPDAVAGITQVSNLSDWLITPGADEESDSDLRARCQGQWNTLSGWHVDRAYKTIISSFDGVDPDGIYFEHTAPRGAGSANANILLDVGIPSASFLAGINTYITGEGHHGHGDDLQAFAMPEIQQDLVLKVWPTKELTTEEQSDLQQSVDNIVQAAFRQSSAYPDVTRTAPFSRFSFSRLGREIHDELELVDSVYFEQPTGGNIVTEMNIPRINSLDVTVEAA